MVKLEGRLFPSSPFNTRNFMKKKSESTRPLKEVIDIWTKRGSQSIAKAQSENDKKIVKLPACKDTERTIPNIIARSALFGVIKRGARPYKEKELVASRSDVKIYYTGKTLDQADCTVWMQALAFTETLGQDVPVNRANFLKLLGKTNGKKDYLWLDSSLHRLMTGVVTVELPQGKLEFHLIEAWGEIKDDNDLLGSSYVLNINPKVVKMWANSQYTQVEWSKRLAIKRGSDLASWLQIYIRSNASTGQPHHISLIKLREWCGLSNMRLRQYRVAMLGALSELVRIQEIKDAIIRKDDMVIFTRIKDRDSSAPHRDSNAPHRDSNAPKDRDSNAPDRDSNAPKDRDSNAPKDRDSNAPKDRDSNAPKDRDSNAPKDRDSNAPDRDSNAFDRDSNALYRDSNAPPNFKSLILKAISRLFFP